eukprot:scaffold11559_cov67-Phaeocystis_antarctica.AAC.3
MRRLPFIRVGSGLRLGSGCGRGWEYRRPEARWRVLGRGRCHAQVQRTRRPLHQHEARTATARRARRRTPHEPAGPRRRLETERVAAVRATAAPKAVRLRALGWSA